MIDANVIFSASLFRKSALSMMVEYIITGDKDFESLDINRPRIMKPRQFQDEYMR
jgi:predicted nucleic acid-binding protein